MKPLARLPALGLLVPAALAAVLSAACGGGGGSTDGAVTGNGFAPDVGPGDVEAYFPNAVGNEWSLSYTWSGIGSFPIHGMITSTVTNPQTQFGVSATVISQVDTAGALGDYESYFGTSPGGITCLGNNDGTDEITPDLVPFPQLLFPVELGPVCTITASDLPAGTDQDGHPLHLNLTQVIENVGFEPLDLTAGSFPSALRQVTTISGELLNPALHQSNPISGTRTLWCVPGVGVAKESTTFSADYSTITSTSELLGYRVDGTRHGFGTPGTIIDGLSPDDGIANPPLGNPAIGSDGMGFLAVGRKITEGTMGYLSTWIAQLVGPDGSALGDSLDLGPPVAPIDILGGQNAVVAFDGTNYLVVYELGVVLPSFAAGCSLVAVRVSAQGAIVGSPTIVAAGTDAQPGATSPVLCFDGSRYLLCLVRGSYLGPAMITGVFVSPSTGAADGQEFTITAVPGQRRNPALAFDGVDYLAVWSEFDGTANGIQGARISTSGDLLDATPIVVHSAQSDRPAIAFGGGNYMVLWEDYRQQTFSGDNVYAGRVSPDGLLLDGDAATGGIALTSSLNIAEVAPTVVFFDGAFLAAWVSNSMTYNDAGPRGARISTQGVVQSSGEAGMLLTPGGFDGRPLLSAGSGGALMAWFSLGAPFLRPNSVSAVSIQPFGR